MLYLRLFYEFFKTGLFSIGGGMATVPFLQDMSSRLKWFTSAQLADMIAVAESTPGPIGVNMATYVGYTTGHSEYGILGGVLGAVIATIGLITPSIIIILIIASFLEKFKDSKAVNAAFYGLRPASVGLIASAGLSIILISFFGCDTVYQLSEGIYINIWQIILALVVFVAIRYIPKVKDFHPLCFIVFSAIVGVILKL